MIIEIGNFAFNIEEKIQFFFRFKYKFKMQAVHLLGRCLTSATFPKINVYKIFEKK